MEDIERGLRDFLSNLTSIARGFELKDLFDILVVTFLIYSLIKLLRETRAGQLVKGIVLFVVVWWLANYFKLVMLSSMLVYFFQSAFLLLVIVFQPEIRKALEQVGRSNVGKSITKAFRGKENINTQLQIMRAIDSTVDACALLQQLRMGALIVFERGTKLHEIVATGTMLDADPSAQLIGNIFFNKAPLHDGALIIRDGKLLAAGCILPLTSSSNVNAMLGTRHRAALGMSEDADAVIVIVSEETAQISVAEKGQLTRDYNRMTLKEALGKLLLENTQDKQGGKKVFGKMGFGSKKRRAEHDE